MLTISNAVYLGSHVDVLVDNGKILTMVPHNHAEIPEDAEIFDAGRLLLFPGLCDCHVHFRDPGFEYKEDITSGLNAAAHGGFSNAMCMANTSPVNDSASVTRYMLDRAHSSHPFGPRLYPIAAATINLDGKEISPLAELAEAGCIAVSNDGRPLESAEITRRIIEYAADLNLKFIDHCEDPWLAKGWVMNEGEVSGNIGVKGQPVCGESIQVARDILLAEYLDLPVHIAHVSTKQSVDLIGWAKQRGIKVTAETCPHYLLLDDHLLSGYESEYKMSPPLRGEEDRLSLLAAIKNGVIDILATDHAPHARHEKETTLDKALFGIIGLELAFSLTFQLINCRILEEADLIRLWQKNPAEIFGLPANNFNPGDPADFFLYDPNFEWVVSQESLYSKSCNTPWLNKQIKGKAVHFWCNGHQLF